MASPKSPVEAEVVGAAAAAGAADTVADDKNKSPSSPDADASQSASTENKDGDAAPSQHEASSSPEPGEASPVGPSESKEATSAAPPLPNEPPPAEADDGWEFHWDATHQAYFFHNRLTNETTWDNPRIPSAGAAPSAAAAAAGGSSTAPAAPEPPKDEKPPAGGYNPAIHGDYDPNAWYAQSYEQDGAEQDQTVDAAAAYAAIGSFNRFTGKWQDGEDNPERHGDEAKSKRQMNAFFDVDAAANAHDGRSLKAERSGKKPTKAELKQFKEKRRARKEEKRRAWLRD